MAGEKVRGQDLVKTLVRQPPGISGPLNHGKCFLKKMGLNFSNINEPKNPKDNEPVSIMFFGVLSN
jgi:hypothetical protein